MIRCRLEAIPEFGTKEGKGTWKPKEGQGAKSDWSYTRMEAARFFHYTWGAFCAEDEVRRSEVIAHFIEHGYREAYAFEKGQEAAKTEAKGPTNERPGWAAVDAYKNFRQGGGVRN